LGDGLPMSGSRAKRTAATIAAGITNVDVYLVSIRLIRFPSITPPHLTHATS
jgi:hypothetical protein